MESHTAIGTPPDVAHLSSLACLWKKPCFGHDHDNHNRGVQDGFDEPFGDQRSPWQPPREIAHGDSERAQEQQGDAELARAFTLLLAPATRDTARRWSQAK